jgi:hypothetical protein
VTDPAHPNYLAHIPGLEGHCVEGGAQMVRVCDGKTLPSEDASKTYAARLRRPRPRNLGRDRSGAKPALMTKIVEGLKDTHKNWWECDTGIAYRIAVSPMRIWLPHATAYWAENAKRVTRT